MIQAPPDRVAIPPVPRTVIYYVLALALVVVTALVAHGIVDVMYLEILSGVGGVFFGVAGSNVASKKAEVPVAVVGDPFGEDGPVN